MTGLARPLVGGINSQVSVGAAHAGVAQADVLQLQLQSLGPAGLEVVGLAVPAEFADGILGQGDGAAGHGSVHAVGVSPDLLSGIGHGLGQLNELLPGPILSGHFNVHLLEDVGVHVDGRGQELASQEVAALAIDVTSVTDGVVQLGLGFLVVLQVGSDVRHVGRSEQGIQIQPHEHVGQSAGGRVVGQVSGDVRGGGANDLDGDVGVDLHEGSSQGFGHLEVVPNHNGQGDGVGGVHSGHVVLISRREGSQRQHHAQCQNQGNEFLHFGVLLFYLI